MLRIPLFPYPQRFEIELGGHAFVFEIVWNDACSLWTLSISRVDDASPVIFGVPLLPGKNLLRQFEHIGFPGELWILSDDGGIEPPNELNIGITSNLYFMEASR